MTPINIKSGFKKTGIFPFDRNIFTSDDFMPTEVTNRLQPLESEASLLQQKENAKKQTMALENSLMEENDQSLEPLEQNLEETQELSHSTIQKDLKKADLAPIENSLASPIECRNYPKAGRRLSKKGRKRRISCIATDTPIKQELEEAAKKRESKMCKKKITNARIITVKKKPKKVEKVTKVLFSSLEEGSENSDADSDVLSSVLEDDGIPLFLLEQPKKDDFVLVKFSGKQIKHYIGKLLTDVEEDEYDVSYLRKSSKVDNVFYFPLEPDLAIVSANDIELILPLPKMEKKTKRQADCYSFPEKILRHFYLG